MTTALPAAPNASATPLIAVTVLLNIAPDHWDGYEPGHLLVNVGDVRVPSREDVTGMLDDLYVALNIGNGSADVDTYRHRGNRSLSIGDVLVIDGVGYAVDNSATGFTRVRVPAASVTRTGRGPAVVGVDA